MEVECEAFTKHSRHSQGSLGEMVVLVKPSPQLGSKAMDGNQHKVEANVLLLGAENVGKSGEHKTELDFECREFRHVYMVYLLSLQMIITCYIYLFAALTVRFLTRRFIGEYGDIGMSNEIYYNTIHNNMQAKCCLFINFTMLSFRINIQSY